MQKSLIVGSLAFALAVPGLAMGQAVEGSNRGVTENEVSARGGGPTAGTSANANSALLRQIAPDVISAQAQLQAAHAGALRLERMLESMGANAQVQPSGELMQLVDQIRTDLAASQAPMASFRTHVSQSPHAAQEQQNLTYASQLLMQSQQNVDMIRQDASHRVTGTALSARVRLLLGQLHAAIGTVERVNRDLR